MHRDHPRRDPDPGRDVRRRRSRATLLLVAYTLGLGLPFLLIAAVYDRAPRAPGARSSATAGSSRSIGGLLVAFIGVAMVFDWLSLFPRYFNFNTAI